jgi:hypothetical protein
MVSPQTHSWRLVSPNGDASPVVRLSLGNAQEFPGELPAATWYRLSGSSVGHQVESASRIGFLFWGPTQSSGFMSLVAPPPELAFMSTHWASWAVCHSCWARTIFRGGRRPLRTLAARDLPRPTGLPLSSAGAETESRSTASIALEGTAIALESVRCQRPEHNGEERGSKADDQRVDEAREVASPCSRRSDAIVPRIGCSNPRPSAEIGF